MESLRSHAEIRTLLGRSRLFEGVPDSLVDRVAEAVECVGLERGETLVREGARGDSAFVLLSGRLRAVVRTHGGAERVVAEISPGELVGEMGLLSSAPRSADLRAVRTSEVAVIPRRLFHELLDEHPVLGIALARLLVDRLRNANQSGAFTAPRTFAVLPCNLDSAARVPEFTRGLARALSAVGSTAHLDDRSGLAAECGRSTVRISAEAVSKFLELEREHDHVVYECGGATAEWHAAAIQHADVVLLVSGDVDDAPAPVLLAPGVREALSSDAGPAVKLIRVHRDERNAYGPTRPQLEASASHGHVHVADSSPQSYERLARILTHRATGLVLGGGGARGLAHLGAVRALREAGIAIDVVGGTSFGSLVGAAVALGWDCDSTLAAFRDALVTNNRLYDYTVPVLALTSGHNLSELLRRVFGHVAIEDMRLPYFCVSSNLSRSRQHVHDRGPLCDALRASVSIPGVFPPVSHEGDLLVDGGLANNCPIDLMRERVTNTGRVIATEVTGQVQLLPGTLASDGIYSGARYLLNRLNPFARSDDVPSMLTVLTSCVAVVNRAFEDQVVRQADVLFRPPVQDYGLLEWKAFDRIVDAGYRYACEVLARG